ncbi:FecR family protein [Chitinophaga arvensicola]|uniref:FecR protein n=1 Tax=Chitinophaga arvensicola TaxID=29529 RepID=A0A1I0RAM5_9BACT|nr:FecR family protein [Chitinophaga arvensicola]SEW37882.1 protein of unknown function [Chitinophaga arvensicola]
MDTIRIAYLLTQFTDKTITAVEMEELEHYLQDDRYDGILTDEIVGQLMKVEASLVNADRFSHLAQRAMQVDKVFKSDINTETNAPIHFLRRWGWAAAVALLLGTGAFFWIAGRKHTTPDDIAKAEINIVPGTNRAVLTVGSNQPITLSNNKKGIAVGTAVTYNDGERIADAGQVLQLVTPRGGQYQAVLPDGTKVWLNAASSIRFPTKFDAGKREVQVTGEAYLEVAKNAASPFIVKTGSSTIQVLGTSFNISAYEDERVQKTTLISGSVKVMIGNSGPFDQNVTLQPGQQAIVSDNKSIDVKKGIDTTQDIAWKNGYFNFESVGMNEVIRQIERWYDIKIQFEGQVTKVKLSGGMDRGVKLSGLIRFFNSYGLQTRLDGRTLYIKEN